MDRKRLLTDWKMLCAVFLILAVACGILYWRSNTAPYRFLQDQKPLFSRLNDTGILVEDAQVYSWNGKFENVAKRARKELEPLGLKMTVAKSATGEEYITFDHPSGLGIVIYHGISKMDHGFIVQDQPTGVTVYISRPLPNNWITKARMWLQPK
jgi:hypothetical protein